MKTTLALFLCLLCSPAFAQQSWWNAVAAQQAPVAAGASLPTFASFVETNGAFLNVYFTNGTAPAAGSYTNGEAGFNFGWLTNNGIPATPALSLTFSEPGFDQTGTSNFTSRTIFATREVRKPYGNFTNVQADVVGSDLLVRFALSDYVSASGSNITGSMKANFWSNNVALNLATTNNSTLALKTSKVVGNWTIPDFQTINGNTLTLAAVAFEQHAKSGNPVACVKFIAHDAHTHTNTGVVTAMTTNLSFTMGDAVPVQEYSTNLDVSTFTDGDTVTCDFVAYPWIGDTTSLMDTRDGKFASGTPFYHTLNFKLNRAGAFSQGYAVVAAGGNDGTGLVVRTNPTSAWRPAAFATIGGAATGLKTDNNTVSSGANNTCSGGTIYLERGVWAYTSVPDDAMTAWVNIGNYPTNNSTAYITNGPGSSRTGSLLCFTNIGLWFESAVNFPFYNHKGYWARNCYITNRSVSMFDKGIMYYTGCTISNNLQFLTQAESAQPVHLIRGNNVRHANHAWNLFTVIGNLCDGNTAASGTVMKTFDASTGPCLYEEDYAIIAYNKIQNVTSSGGSTFAFYGNASSEVCTNGAAIVGNIFEQAGGAGPTFSVKSDNAAGAVTNIMVWNNVAMGFWDNIFYNDLGTAPVWNIYCTERGNIWQAHHNKSDTFEGTPNGNRIGDWPQMWGVGFVGNYDMQKTNITSSGAFTLEFAGLNSFQPGWILAATPYWNSQQCTTNYAQFVTTGSYNSGGAGAGNGDYHLKTTSPIGAVAVGWHGIPYDIESVARSDSDPPGVYVTLKP